jgi:hypothetical protein
LRKELLEVSDHVALRFLDSRRSGYSRHRWTIFIESEPNVNTERASLRPEVTRASEPGTGCGGTGLKKWWFYA